MARSTKADKARQLNAAYAMRQRNVPLPEAMQRLSREFNLSERQAYRYLEEATHLNRPVEVSEATVPITLKLPAGTASLLRAYARRSGLTIGAIVTRALAAFLSTQRRHG
jgi:AraC-like DNA-binding protein